jgi:hypothetical protein
MLRIFTYTGLVVRRMWAKRGMLIGSFLGATLVVALLAIVPLYESSIAAIDLLFTFRQAPAVSVDLRASGPTEPFDVVSATAASAAVDEQLSLVEPWYVSAEERTLSRELFVIPPDTPDWLSLAEGYREAEAVYRASVAEAVDADPDDLGPPDAVAALVASFTEIDLPDAPRPPYPQPPQEAIQTRILSSPDIESRVELTAGEWPAAEEPGIVDPLLRVVIGEDFARLGQLEVGDRTFLRPFIGLPSSFEMVEIAGVMRPLDPGQPLWEGTSPGSLVLLSEESFEDWLTPIPVTYQLDPWLRPVRGLGSLTATRSWYLPLQRDVVELGNVDDLSSSVSRFNAELGRVAGIAVSTSLPALIESFDVRTTIFGGPILAMLALVVAGALYFLVYTAALTLEREGPEMALLRSRGAGSWQTIGIHLLQSAIFAVAAAAIAPWVARFLISLTGRIPPMSDLTGGDPLSVTQVQSLLPWIGGGALLVFVTMGLAILPFARRSVLELRSLAARPTRLSVWQRYYVDLFLVVLAAILLFELRQRGLVDTERDEVGLDPFAIASPALFLFAGALLLLRVLPSVLRGIGSAMARMPRLSASLPGWHLGRNPVPYGRLALLIWLTTGFGAFALTYAQTLDQSYQDRAAFAAGSDVRVVTDQAGFLDPPEGTQAAAVYRSQGAPRLAARSAELLAVRPEQFSQVVAWRSDFGASAPLEVFAALRPEGVPPDLGVELPAGTTALRVEAARVPDQPPEETGEPLQLLVRVVDLRGRLWTFESTDISDVEWTTVEVSLDPAEARGERPEVIRGPLVLQSMWLERRAAGGEPILLGERVLYEALRAVTPAGEELLGDAVTAELDGHNGFVVEDTDGDAAARAALRIAGEGTGQTQVTSSPLYRPGRVPSWFVPPRDQLGDVPHLAATPEPLNVLLDGVAGGLAAIDLGDDALFGIEGEQIPGTRVGALSEVPTAASTTTTGLMVVDLDALMQWLNGEPTWGLRTNLARLAEPQELWVATDDVDGTVRRLVSAIGEEPDEIVTIQGAETDFSSRPVQVGLVAILFVGAITGVVLALAGVTGYVVIAVRRRAREMGVLRALGFDRRGVAATFAVEQLMVLMLGAVIGVAAGIGLMRLMLPFLQLGETTDELIPSVVLALDPVVLGLYLAAVSTLVFISVVWSTRSVSARRLSEVLREVDR